MIRYFIIIEGKIIIFLRRDHRLKDKTVSKKEAKRVDSKVQQKDLKVFHKYIMVHQSLK